TSEVMAGNNIHIPLCGQACHYFDFHSYTSFKYKDDMIDALEKEIELRKSELGSENIETDYFVDRTPSVLSVEEMNKILDAVGRNFTMIANPEITLEANPDDLSKEKIKELSQTPINRLSIGVQSFFYDDLQIMNRSHNAQNAYESVADA